MKKFCKKINLVILCMATLFLVGMLGACSFKDVDIDFTTSEIVLSCGESVDLSEYVTLTNLNSEDVEFKLSDSSYATISGSVLTSQKAGRTYAYATYKGSSFASVALRIKAVFSAPTNFDLTENADGQTATLTWDVVSGYFADDSDLTVAKEYEVSYSLTTYDEDDQPVTITKVVKTSTNSIVLEQGMYELSVKAIGTGNFDSSATSEIQKLYIGFMQKLETSDISWSDGVLSWNDVSDASYSIVVDGSEVATDLSVTSFDLSDFLDASTGTQFSVQVKVCDLNGEKYASYSDIITISKLSTVQVTKSNGELTAQAVANADEYYAEVTLKDSDQKTYVSLTNAMTFSLTGYDSGVYSVSVVAKNTSITENSSTYFYHSTSDVGYVYKLPNCVLSGDGESDSEENKLILKVTTSSLIVGASVVIDSTSYSTIYASGDSVSFSYSLTKVGSVTLSATLIATTLNVVVDGVDVYVLASDPSEEIVVTKLTNFSSDVVHSYETIQTEGGTAEVSVFSFSPVEGAESYTLLSYDEGSGNYVEVDENLFSVEVEETAKIVLTDKIENLFSAVNGTFMFKVSTTTADDSLAINSRVEKSLTLLSAPTSGTMTGSTTFTWTNSASLYTITYYKLTYQQYTSSNLDLTQLEGVTVENLATNSYDFTSAGYYLIQIWAISSDANTEISSLTALMTRFFKTEQIEAPTISFGYSADYVSAVEYENASGYYLQISNSKNAANVGSYVVSLDGSEAKIEASSTYTIFKFSASDTFASGTYTITVKAVGADATLFLESEATSLTVTRLENLTAENMEIEEYVQNPTLTVSSAQSGATAIQILSSDLTVLAESDETDISASVKLSSLSDFSLTFVLQGSSVSGNLYQPTSGVVFLESSTTIDFTRIDSPSDLSFYDGDLTFTSTSTPEAFVLTISGETDGGSTLSMNVVVFTTSDKIKVMYDGKTIDTNAISSAYLQGSGSFTIDLDGIVDIIKTDSAINNAQISTSLFYAQMSSLTFAVYAYNVAELKSDTTKISLPSLCALSGSNRYIEIEKLDSTTLRYEDGNLTWTEIGSNLTYQSATKYVLYNSTGVVVTQSYTETSYETSAVETYYIIATNPYYLDSATSNYVTLTKLAYVDSLTLNDDELSFSYDDTTGVSAFSVNKTSQKSTTIKISDISGGTVTIKVLGSTNPTTIAEDYTGDVTYYLDSDEKTWNITELSDVLPSSATISVSGNIISWTAATVTDGNLEYYLIFTDEEGKTGTIYTTTNSLTWTYEDENNQSELYSLLDGLSGGTITIQLYLHTKDNSSVPASDSVYTIYYADYDSTLEEYNYSQYLTDTKEPLTASITKYSDPTITSVAFADYDNEDSSYTNTPDITVNFTGNYGSSVDFLLYIGGDSYYASTSNKDNNLLVSCGGETEEGSGIYSYSLTISIDDFNYSEVASGESFGIEIMALSTQTPADFPSSSATATITRAKSVSFKLASATGGYASTVSILSNTSNCQIVLVFEIDGKTTYKTLAYNKTSYDFSSLLPSDGGEITVKAFARSSASSFLLASQMTSVTETVIPAVTAITATSNGFSFSTSVEEDVTLTYVISFGVSGQEATIFTLKGDSGATCEFEVPDAYGDNDYSISIQVFCSGYVNSVAKSLTFTLKRLASVGTITIARTGDTQYISWDKVTNASGYLIEVTTSVNDTETTLISTTDKSSSDTISISLDSLFADVFDDDSTKNLFVSSREVTIYVTALGGTVESVTYQNAQAKYFTATVLGNEASATESFSVNAYGLMVYSGSLTSAYYNFVNSKMEYASSWAAINTSGVLDSTGLTGGANYMIAIRYRGSEKTYNTSEGILLDSFTYTTPSGSMYAKNSDIVAISASTDEDGTSVCFTLNVSGAKMQFFVGTTAAAILTGDVKTFSIESTSEYYNYSLTSILTLLGISSTESTSHTLYFWVLSPSYALISNSSSLKVTNGASANFVDIVKGVLTTKSDEDSADYVNSYALFTYDSTTVGIYVSTTYTDEEGISQDLEVFYTTSQMTATNIKYDTVYYLSDDTTGVTYSYFAINLTSFFETYLSSYSGTYSLSFVRVSEGTSISISAAQTQKVYRMAPVSEVGVSYGNLWWSGTDARTENYYIYLSNSLVSEDESYACSLFVTDASVQTYEGANLYVSKDTYYYVAVQSVNTSSGSVISSQLVYKLDSGETEEAIRKIQVNDYLTLEDGSLFFEFDLTEATLLEMLSSSEPLKYYFSSPFSFTLEQLSSEAISVRFKFTNATSNKTYTIDVPVAQLLKASSDTKSVWAELKGSSSYTFSSDLQTQLDNLIENDECGLACVSTIFDDVFEAVQSGEYTIQYCIIGVSTNFNSSWQYVYAEPDSQPTSIDSDNSTYYIFDEDEGSYKLATSYSSNETYYVLSTYVTAQATTSVTTTTSGYLSTFTVKFKEVQIQTSTSESSYATSYVLRLKSNSATSLSDYIAFNISKNASSGNWTLTQIGVDSSSSVSVSEADGYLSFCFNYNDGNSLLGKFEIDSSEKYVMEIYAVGSGTAISGKSNSMTVTLLDISSLAVTNGVFTWTTTNARATTVMYNSTGSTTIHSMTLNSADLFTYNLVDSEVTSGGSFSISFMVQGAVSGSQVLIDSPTYSFEKVYNLAAPTLSVDIGQLSIDGSSNATYFNSTYISSTYNYIYEITNNSGTSSSYTLASNQKKVLYEAGTTGMTSSNTDPDYLYKQTESQASSFIVNAIGSTGSIEYSSGSGSKYYVKTGSLVEGGGLSIALSSTSSSISAVMLNTPKNITVSNGVFTWDEIGEDPLEPVTTHNAFELYLDQTKYSIIYRVYIEKYTKNTDNTTNVTYSYTIYTTKNTFDSSTLQQEDDEGSYLRITVQAFVAKISESLPSGNYCILEEGGYAYGTGMYTDGTTYVLMGNGETLSGVVRIPSVVEGSIKVNSDGKLTWTVDISEYVGNFISKADDFEEYFEFVLTDENGNILEGDFEMTTASGILTVVFTENDGSLASGEQKISIYVNLREDYSGTINFVKSYTSSEVTIYKFETITSEDYEIVTSGNLEYLSFETFFKTEGNENEIVTMTINGEIYQLSSSAYKLYITTEEVTLIAEEGFVLSLQDSSYCAYVILESGAQVYFTVSGQDSEGANCLTSDQSETFGIVRPTWDVDAEISWSESLQEFSWEYPWKMIESEAEVTEYQAFFVQETSLFTDSTLQNDSGISLSEFDGGVVILSVGDDVTKILYASEVYFIASDSYVFTFTATLDAEATLFFDSELSDDSGISLSEVQIVSVGDTVTSVWHEGQTYYISTTTYSVATATLSAENLFTIVSEGEEKSIICTASGLFYSISTSLIVDPEFVVEIRYASESSSRTYTISGTSFQPSVMGTISAFSVRISFGANNFKSASISYSASVTASLFESGSGTESDPYVISTASQFQNLSLRKAKESYLTSYTSSGETVEEEEIFYFEISTNDDSSSRTFYLGSISGIFFSGEFTGVLEGNGATISYTSTGVQTLEEQVSISSSQTKVTPSATSSDSIAYTAGSALFEKFSSTASVSNLTVSATFSSSSSISENALVSALVLVNEGYVSGISVSNFTTNFKVTTNTGNGVGIIAFGGVASINNGNLVSSSLDCDISISDETLVVCVGGIAYTNFGSIISCQTNGNISVQKTETYGSLQVGGIVSANATSTSTGQIIVCTNKASITLMCSSASNTITCYAGVYAGYNLAGTNTILNCSNSGSLNSSNNITNLS